MPIKLIAIDLDGTLLNSEHKVTKKVKLALQKAMDKGIHIILASGRPYSGIAPYLKTLALNQQGHFCISNNGSVVHETQTGKHLVEHLLSFQDYLNIEKLSRTIGASMHALADNKIFTANHHINHYTVHEAYITQSPLVFSTVEQMDKSLNFSKLMLCDEPDKLNIAIDKIPKAFYQQYCLLRSTPFFLECLHPNANKGNAMLEVASLLDIHQNEIMCIGDQNNDLPMFKYAHYKIAMGNAIDDVKNASTFVTLDNDHDGVAIALDKFI